VPDHAVGRAEDLVAERIAIDRYRDALASLEE